MKPRGGNKKHTAIDFSEDLPVLHLHAAGIDVGNAEHYVAVPPGSDPQPVQRFASFTADLHRMAQWLKRCRIETVVMQATGVYWVAPFEVFAERWLAGPCRYR